MSAWDQYTLIISRDEQIIILIAVLLILYIIYKWRRSSNVRGSMILVDKAQFEELRYKIADYTNAKCSNLADMLAAMSKRMALSNGKFHEGQRWYKLWWSAIFKAGGKYAHDLPDPSKYLKELVFENERITRLYEEVKNQRDAQNNENEKLRLRNKQLESALDAKIDASLSTIKRTAQTEEALNDLAGSLGVSDRNALARAEGKIEVYERLRPAPTAPATP